MSFGERTFHMALNESDYPVSQDSPKFAPWPTDKKQALASQYEADIESLRKLDYVEFLQPEQQA